MEERLKVNYNHANFMDHSLRHQYLKASKSGKSVEILQYDYVAYTYKETSIYFKPNKVGIEGVLLLTDKRLYEERDFSILSVLV
ncbi:Uridine kinase [Acinetobacter baumannii]|nr:Uridine kinase [Acinetobacter baumannii]